MMTAYCAYIQTIDSKNSRKGKGNRFVCDTGGASARRDR